MIHGQKTLSCCERYEIGGHPFFLFPTVTNNKHNAQICHAETTGITYFRARGSSRQYILEKLKLFINIFLE